MKINIFAVLTAAISSFVLGGLWYSVLFKTVWMKANEFNDSHLKKGNPAVIFGLSFLLMLIMAANLAAFIGGEQASLTWGMTAGGLAGLGWVALALTVTALFERRSFRYVLINGAYWIVAFILMGGIVGGWR
jgi:hypothetical protein